MPITVTTTDDEGFNGGSETDETNDGNGLSLREAFDLIGAGTSTGPITFAAPGDTFFLNDGPLNVAADIVLDGDLNDDGVADIFINNITGSELMIIAVNGVTFENAGVFFTLDATGSGSIFATGFRVLSDDVEIINGGDIFTQSDAISDGRILGSAIEFSGDNFTLTNQLGATIVTASRVAIDVARPQDPDTFENLPSALNTTVINDGLIEGADDAIRLASGTITNSGTIRAAGTYDLDGSRDGFEPGTTSDAIQTFANYDPAFMPNASDLVVVNNLEGGLIEGGRSAVFVSGGLTVNNEGTIAALGAAVFAGQFSVFVDPSVVFSDTIFSLSNTATGIIERVGGSQDASFNSAESFAAIRTGGEMESATVINAGQILSSDLVISAYNAITITNEATGLIQGDTDSLGDDAIAFLGSQFADFEVDTSVSFPFPFSGLEFVSTQNISINEDNELVTDFGTFPFSGGQVELVNLSNVDAPGLFPLVDLAASQANGVVIFQSDANGVLYPASIDVPTTDFGILTVEYVSGTGFTVIDASGNPAFAVPIGVDFADTITNDGTIIGDVLTGLGDDVVTNNNTIDGEVNLGVGNDIYNGASGVGDYVVLGGDGLDVITTGIGNDTISGGAGADTIDGGAGNNTAGYAGSTARVVVNLGSGIANSGYAQGDSLTNIRNLTGSYFNDVLTGDAVNNSLNGLSGDDVLQGLAGDDTLLGQDGMDTLRGGAGNDLLDGGSGDDTVTGNAGEDIISGGDGDDTLSGGFSGDDLFGGAGNDLINGFEGSDTIDGGGDNDQINGGAGFDVIDGGAGDDIINGGTSSDTITGGDGDDMIFGVDGGDSIDGGLGNDTISGGSGSDFVQGKAGNDNISGGFSDDMLFGGVGDDEIIGDRGRDEIHGGEGNDIVQGGVGEDIVDGGNGDDIVIGGTGRDTIFGGAGNDVMNGAEGVDVIDGGTGNDSLRGGTNADTFVFRTDFGQDTIVDFATNDFIDFSGFAGFNSLAEVLAAAVQSGTDVIITFDANTTLTIEDYDVNNLNAGDFIF